jgi:hypothetical protein
MKLTNLIAFILTAIVAVSCNPIKQIMKNQAKFNLIKDEVIRQGFCANDTTIITASDTLIQYDTTIQKETEILTIGDTVYVTKWQTRDIVKKLTIRDTIKSVVVDNARIQVLQADYYKMKSTADEWKQKAQERLSYLILAIVIVGLWLFFKFKP